MPRFSSFFEKARVNLRHVAAFYHEEVSGIAVWWLWNTPFRVFEVFFTPLLFKYFAATFGGRSPWYGGNFMASMISGLMVNVYLDSSLEVYSPSVMALYGGKVGVGGPLLSRRDCLRLAGASPFTFTFARVTWRYLMETLVLASYLLLGVLPFNFEASPQADALLALTALLLGIAACSGLGLISASTCWLASS